MEEFNIESVKQYSIGSIDLLLNCKTKTVTRMLGDLYKRTDVHIPAVLPDGTQIQTIGGNAFMGELFGNVYIDDGITIMPNAFSAAYIETLRWPRGISTIPSCCFSNSSVRRIEGLENITSVENGAFYGAIIRTFGWPPKAKEIPEDCFNGSVLEKITGIENVTSIGEAAFCETKIQNFA